MKIQITLKTLVLAICLLAQTTLFTANAESRTINVETAGSLPTLISESEKFAITKLTLTGSLNGTDIRLIREMAGVDVKFEDTEGKLSVLDMSGAKIVAGGDFYLSILTGVGSETVDYYSADDSIGDYMFTFSRNLTSVALPDDVTDIGQYVFRSCDRLSSIVIPNSVVSIGSYAFSLTGLTTVAIGNNVTSLGEGVFSNCKKITSIVINGNPSMKERVFESCPELSSVTINGDLAAIGDNMFAGCGKLASINIPTSVTTIGSAAFTNAGLTSITLDNHITSIKYAAFSNCSKLTSVVINGNPSIDNGVFRSCTALTSVTIGNGLTTIGQQMFDLCSKLTSITIPESVTTIKKQAFGSTGLKEVYFYKLAPPTCAADAFENVDAGVCKLYVPVGSKQDYWLATGWKSYNNVIEMVNSNVSVVYNEGGTVLINGESISEKEIEYKATLTFTVTPAAGYRLKSATFNDADVTAEVADNQYVSPAITEDATFEVEFEVIIAIDGSSVNFNIYTNGSLLIVERAGDVVTVYNQSGMPVQSVATSDGRAEIQLPQRGIYIIQTQLGVRKIVW